MGSSLTSGWNQRGSEAAESAEPFFGRYGLSLDRLALAFAQALWPVANTVSSAHGGPRRGHNLLQAVSRYKRYIRCAFKSMIHHTPAPARPPTHILHPYHPYATYASLFPHAHLTHTLPSTHPHHILGPPSHYTMTSYIFVPSLSQ